MICDYNPILLVNGNLFEFLWSLRKEILTDEKKDLFRSVDKLYLRNMIVVSG